MNKSVKLFFALLFLIFFTLFSQIGVYAQELELGFNKETSFLDRDAECNGPGQIKYDDGTFENGYGWNNTVTDGRIVMLFTPSTYPWNFNTFCIAYARLATGPSSFNFDIVVYDATGAGGSPGNLVATVAGVTATGIPVWPTLAWYNYDISSIPALSSGSYYIGAKWDASILSGLIAIGADQSTTTPLQPGYRWANAGPWDPIQTNSPTYRAMGIRTLGSSGPPVGPGLATNPNPANGATGVSLTGLTLSWTNPVGATSNEVYFGTNPGSLNLIHSGSLVNSISAPLPLNYFTDYYWRVDEIGGGTTTGSLWSFKTMLDPAGVILPYSQSFSTTSFPPFWSQTFSGGVTSNRWGISQTNVAGGTPNEIFAQWVQQVGISRLIIGPINTSGMTNLGLSFRQFFDDFGPGVTARIQSSVNGSTWTNEAFSFVSGGGNIGPELVYTTVNSNLGSTTYIAWVLDGDHYEFDFWVIDDVSIYQLLANDVGTIAIDLAATLPTGIIAPQARVQNFGTAANSFNVQMTITGGYVSNRTVTNLAPNTSQLITFDNWNATGGAYTVNVCTQLGTDQNTSNDCLPKNVSVIDGWTHNSVYPTTTYLGSGVAGNGFLYSIGGNTTSALGTECYKFNVSTNTWTQIASLPAGRRVAASALIGNFVYAIGGSDMTSVYQSTVYRYDITGDSWSTVASLPSPYAWGKAVGYNNRIYFAGGVKDSSGGIISSAVFVYDVSANTWSPATSMPGPKFGGAFSISGNKLIYVAGADGIGISSSVFVGTIDGGNPLNISWTTALNRYPGIDKDIMFASGTKLTDLFQGDTQQKKNSLLPIDATAYPAGTMYRFDGAPWGSDGIIVAGGSPTSAFVPAVPNPCYVYKPDTDTWIQKGQVPTAVLGSSLGTVQDGSTWKLVIASGLGTSDVTNATQIFTEDLGGGATTFQLSVSVSNGWNMVSIPGLHPVNQNVNTWWSGKDPGAGVFRFTTGYNPVTEVAPGIGYWMKHVGANTYNTGDEWPAGGIQIVPNVPLAGITGWNLIGGYHLTVATSGITTTPGGLQSGSVFGYTPGTGYSPAANLVPGYGYWIKLTAGGQINIPTSLAKGSPVTEYIKSDWGRIILTDAAGKSYTLYSVNGEVDLNQYELPPMPPAGMFDVRYGSQRMAEEIGSEIQTIEMSGIEYPVTIRVEGMTLRVQDETGKIVNAVLKSGEDVVISNPMVEKLKVSGNVIPETYSLEQNYPNPFNPATTIEFSIPEDVDNVKLTIYDALGQKVAELVNGKLEAGRYSYQWDASKVATGLYIYQLQTNKFTSTKKMMLLK